VVLAGTLLLLIGIFQIFQGIAAITRDSFYVVGANYFYKIDTTTWGWIHLGVGIVAVLAGFFLFTGMLWARIIGIAMASISAIANFFWAPYYPLWSLLIIAVDLFAIWAIANAGAREMRGAGYGDEMAVAGDRSYAGERGQSSERWPSTNQPTGRHWAGEPTKEGAASRGAAEDRERAEAMSQRGGYGGQQGPQGQQPGYGQNPGTYGDAGTYGQTSGEQQQGYTGQQPPPGPGQPGGTPPR
jgi:hypothetical protein